MDSQDGQEELQLPDAGSPGGQTAEYLQKQIHELQARLKEHSKNSTIDAANLSEQFLYLQKLLLGVLVSLIVLSLGVCLFMGKQMRIVRAQLVDQRPRILRNLTEFQMKLDPNIKKFTAQLQAFAASNPDFQLILQRHRNRLPQYFINVAPSVPNDSQVFTNSPPDPK
jgi:hypothetical protein